MSEEWERIIKEPVGFVVFLICILLVRWLFGDDWVIILGLAAIYGKCCLNA